MNEILNLNTLCRCCHLDGCFRDLNVPYETENGVEIYEKMLQDTLGIRILQPPMYMSYNICDDCIRKLKSASQFKEQVLSYEKKFKIYCIKEQFPYENTIIERLKTDVGLIDEFDQNNLGGIIRHQAHRGSNIASDTDSTDLIEDEIALELDLKQSIEDETKDVQDKESETEDEETEDETETETIKKEIAKKKHVPEKKNRDYLQMCRKLFKTHITPTKSKTKKTYCCETCRGSYQTKKDVYKHIRQGCKHPISHFKCDSCGKYYKYARDLKRHTTSRNGNPRSCRHCGSKFPCKTSLLIHENTHGEPQLYKCYICLKTLLDSTSLQTHIHGHLITPTDVGVIRDKSCDFCGRTFDKLNLIKHINTVHLKQNSYSCPICGKTYKANIHVKDHLERFHPDDPRPYKCEKCTKTFVDYQTLKLHSLTHENKFLCKYCFDNFGNNDDMKTHIQENHADERHVSSPVNTDEPCT